MFQNSKEVTFCFNGKICYFNLRPPHRCHKHGITTTTVKIGGNISPYNGRTINRTDLNHCEFVYRVTTRENEGTGREAQGVGRDMSCHVLTEVCLPRGLHAVLPLSQVLSEKRKWRRTWKADEYLYSLCLLKTCGRLGRQTSDSTKTSACLK